MTEFSAPLSKRTVDPYLIAFGLLLMIVSGYSIWSTSYSLNPTILSAGKIVRCQGGCKYKSPDDYFWMNAHNNLSVLNKSMVYTSAQSSASIVLHSGTTLTLYPNSLVQIIIDKKGSTIDIMEGKINFDRVAPNGSDHIRLKGKELLLPKSVDDGLAEISVAPEFLVMTTPEIVFLRGSNTFVPVTIKNGVGPFLTHLEGDGDDKGTISDESIFSHKVKNPGIYTIKVEDSKGSFATKLVNIIDLRVPELKTPLSGEFLYSRSFSPTGQFDPLKTEFSLSRENAVVFKGPILAMPKDLAPGNYQISARKIFDNESGEWSSPISFKLVNSKRPQIDGLNSSLFFDKVHLAWKKILPVVHMLTINNLKTSEQVKFALTEESFDYFPKQSGEYSWSVSPVVLDGFDEKTEQQMFTFIDLATFLIEPKDKVLFTSSELKEEVSFKWSLLSDKDLSMVLELKTGKNKDSHSVSGKDSLQLELPNLKDYQWRLVFKANDKIFMTPEKSFKIEPPPPVAPIREDEIIFKD